MNPHIYDALSEAKMVLASVNNCKIYLPETSSRKSHDDYEEITVDKVDRLDLLPQDKLVSIKENFDAVGQIAFTGTSHLNQIQSIVYESAYKSNKNLLIAAPTGAGKTNVAMMTVLNELRNYFKPGTTQLIANNISEKFKIIYIAPMKSLATEQTENFNSRLKTLGIKTRELTGDISLTEYEFSQTHIIVTTPEKWDVVTRKSKGDVDLLSLVRLLILDEVHLLQSDRGPVLEAVVARTLRYVESSQRMTRIVGLSATLPNYIDIALFLRVNPLDGLFYFDNRFRPVPLMQKFIGVRPHDSKSQSRVMDKLCYNLAVHYASLDKQIMIFVHTRNSTKNVATKLKEMIQLHNKVEIFEPDIAKSQEANKLMANPRNKLLKDLFAVGFGVHHAGMIRQDRLLVEKLFRLGALKVLVCTSTLAWGVNFPAHAVIIRGTEIYDSSAGKFVDIGLLDVMQIFGRAGRPQYDNEGQAIILTALNKMDFYLKLLTNQTPIESNFIKYLTDNLNAEVVSGTVSSIAEGMEWLRYTYLNVRVRQNPLVYGFDQVDIDFDPSLATVRKMLLEVCARQLDEAQMCNFEPNSGLLEPTVLGRIASHFYINFETVAKYNELLFDGLGYSAIFSLIGEAQEFQQIKFREEEADELENLRRMCHLPLVSGAVETTSGKVNCLLQAYISRAYIKSHSLVSDLMYISQNAVRIARGLFEYSLKKSWSRTALNLVRVCKMLETQQWYYQTPLRHFDLPDEVIHRLEDTKTSVEDICHMTAARIAKVINFPEKLAQTTKNYVNHLPYVIVEGVVKPINVNLLVLSLTLQPSFKWNERYHGKTAQTFWLWVLDGELTEQICYSELIRFSKDDVQSERKISFNVNLTLIDSTLDDGTMGARIPNAYTVYVVSNNWNACDYEYSIECLSLLLPEEVTSYTRVPDNIEKLSLSLFDNSLYHEIFHNVIPAGDGYPGPANSDSIDASARTFNVIQSQVFFPVYHSDRNLLICAPAGSGKTLIAEIAMLRVFTRHIKGRKRKIVYINTSELSADYKYRDWRDRIGFHLAKQFAIFQGNESDMRVFRQSDVIVSTADKFDLWLDNNQIVEDDLMTISLFVFDDMHEISGPCGVKLELMISKLKAFGLKNPRFVSRFIGLSNTLANHRDVSDWLGIKKEVNAYNFNAATRPIQLISHVVGFPERFYSPRMAMMNKPIFKAILNHSPNMPVMIFVSSTKQCNLTALDLVSNLANAYQSRQLQWLKMDSKTLNSILENIHDTNLRLSLEFGICLLHPGLKLSDKKTVEELWTFNKMQVLICTYGYAMRSSFRARLVIVKGVQFHDQTTNRLVNYAPNQVMQMIGRAGRSNIDTVGIAMLFVSDILEEYYRKFMHEPFPAESRLLDLSDDITLERYLVPKDINKILEEQISKTTNQNTQQNEDGSNKPKVNKVKPNRSITEKPIEDSLTTKKKQIIQETAIGRLNHTFLVQRLAKNPSYYGLTGAMSATTFLQKFLESKRINDSAYLLADKN